MKTRNKIQRIRILYGIFISIMGICLGLFFLDILKSEEPLLTEKIENQMPQNHNFGIAVTDLHSGNDLYMAAHEVDGVPEGISVRTHVSRFDVEMYADDIERIHNTKMHWVFALQMFASAALACIVVMSIIVLVSLYRNAKCGKVFQKKNIQWIRFIGVLLIALSLSVDLSVYIERLAVLEVIQNTLWEPKVEFTLHFTRIFFGILIVFVAELFNVGFDMQEEQELTI